MLRTVQNLRRLHILSMNSSAPLQKKVVFSITKVKAVNVSAGSTTVTAQKSAMGVALFWKTQKTGIIPIIYTFSEVVQNRLGEDNFYINNFCYLPPKKPTHPTNQTKHTPKAIDLICSEKTSRDSSRDNICDARIVSSSFMLLICPLRAKHFFVYVIECSCNSIIIK